MKTIRFPRALTISVFALACLLSSALVLAETFVFSGTISVPGEYDTYTFFAEEDQYIQITLECESPDTLDPYIELYDPNDNYLTYDDDSGDKECGGYWSAELTFRAQTTGTYTVYVYDYDQATGPYTLTIEARLRLDQPQWFDPGDDRINRQAYASASIYCDAGTSQLVVYAIDPNGKGQLSLAVPYADLPATPADANVLVAQQGSMMIHRLTSGEYQFTGSADAEGKQYVAIWDGCPYTYLNAYILQNGVLTQTETNTP